MSDDDGPAWAAFLARVDPAALERERFTPDEVLRRSAAIRDVLHRRFAYQISEDQAYRELHDIDPQQYPMIGDTP